MKIFAHRGASRSYPENTMLAFKEALKQGADGIELDVQLTKDGIPVVIHDEKVDRTTNGTGFVKDYSFSDLQKLNAAAKFGGAFGRESIPSLKEVLLWLRPSGLLCNIELKNGVFLYQGMEEKVIAQVRGLGLEERIVLSSFNHYSLVHCFRTAPEIETAPLYRDGLYMPWVYAAAIGAGGMHPSIHAAPPPIIAEAEEQGIQVRPYTVNREEEMIKLLEVNCSGIITDYPAKAVQIVKTR